MKHNRLKLSYQGPIKFNFVLCNQKKKHFPADTATTWDQRKYERAREQG